MLWLQLGKFELRFDKVTGFKYTFAIRFRITQLKKNRIGAAPRTPLQLQKYKQNEKKIERKRKGRGKEKERTMKGKCKEMPPQIHLNSIRKASWSLCWAHVGKMTYFGRSKPDEKPPGAAKRHPRQAQTLPKDSRIEPKDPPKCKFWVTWWHVPTPNLLWFCIGVSKIFA